VNVTPSNAKANSSATNRQWFRVFMVVLLSFYPPF
jgi:hypothetical protein